MTIDRGQRTMENGQRSIVHRLIKSRFVLKGRLILSEEVWFTL